MKSEENTFVMYPANSIDTALSLLKNISGIQLLAGATLDKHIKSDFFSVSSIPEMLSIDRKERYIDVGAAVSLGSLLDLGESRIPSVLLQPYGQSSSWPLPADASARVAGWRLCSI